MPLRKILACHAFLCFGFLPSAPPSLEIATNATGTFVMSGAECLVSILSNRYLRFRGRTNDDHWLGVARRPTSWDMGWNYDDLGTRGFLATNIALRNDLQGQRPSIQIHGVKPRLPGFEAGFSLEGNWLEEAQAYAWTLSTRLRGPAKAWLKATAYRDGSLQVYDFFLHRGYQGEAGGKPVLYDRWVRSVDGKAWEQIPRMAVSFASRPVKTNYVALYFQLKRGGAFGYLDREEGGWIEELIDFPASLPDPHIEICWNGLDVHHYLEGVVPTGNAPDYMEAFFKVAFTPVTAEKARAILAAAAEIPYRQLPEYQTPIWDPHASNTFESLPSGVHRGKSTEATWWANDYRCAWETKLGFDDRFSLRISSDGPRAEPRTKVVSNRQGVPVSSWYAFQWGAPFDSLGWIMAKNRDACLITARVKTEGVSGGACLKVAQSDTRDGIPDPNGAYAWTRSKILKGDNPWTELSVVYRQVTNTDRILVLELEGEGRAWFDCVFVRRLPPEAGPRSGPASGL